MFDDGGDDFKWHSIFVLSGGRFQSVSRYCWKDFQGQRSKVKVMAWPMVKAYILMVWHRGWLF